MRKMLCGIVWIAAITAATMNSSAATATTYSPQLLGVSPGFDGSMGISINDNDTAICSSATSSDVSGVFTWSHSTGLVDLSLEKIVAAYGINNYGQTVGMEKDSQSGWYRPFIRNTDGGRTSLHLPSGVADAWPAQINDNGQVAMLLYYRDSEHNVTDTEVAIVGVDGSTVHVDAPSGYSEVWSLSNTGYVGMKSGNRAYVWSQTGGLSLLPDLVSGDSTAIWDVNDLGFSVGSSGNRAVVWSPSGGVTDLGSGIAFGINNNQQVVGSTGGRATLWNPDGSIVDLGFGESSSAYAINNHGWIVGGVTYPDAHTYQMAVLWEPVPVPEPSSMLTLASLMTGFAAFVRRRRS